MEVTRTNKMTGRETVMDIPNLTERELLDWAEGNDPIQYKLAHLTAGEREFIMTGITPTEWDNMWSDQVTEELERDAEREAKLKNDLRKRAALEKEVVKGFYAAEQVNVSLTKLNESGAEVHPEDIVTRMEFHPSGRLLTIQFEFKKLTHMNQNVYMSEDEVERDAQGYFEEVDKVVSALTEYINGTMR